jgi:hypothetical protein
VSPVAQAELFSIASATPQSGRAFGRVMASAEAGSHRGFHLLLGAEATAQADASIRDVLAASLSAGVGAKATVEFAAAFPLDLFRGAGVVARLDASAEAAAWLRATIGLDLHTFQTAVHARFGGVLADLCDIFLDEARVEAGLWARAAFAAEVRGEVALTGSLLPTATANPGFSFSMSYGAGVTFAAGGDFIANIGLENPRRLLNRLSDRLTAEVVGRAEAHVATLTGDPRLAAEAALSELRLLLPLSGRAAFELGAALARSGPDDRRGDAAVAIVTSLAGEARELLLRQVLELGLTQARAALDLPTLRQAFDQLDGPGQDVVIDDLQALKQALVALDTLPPTAEAAWLAAVVGCVEPAQALIDHGLLDGPAAESLADALTYVWAGGVLLGRVASWLEQPDNTALFGQSVPPAPQGTAARVAGAIGKPAGLGITLTDLVSFLVGADLMAELRAAPAPIGPLVTWLDQAFAAGTGADLLEQLLVELVSPTEAHVEQLLAQLGQSVGEAIRDRVVPLLLDPVRAADPSNAALAEALDDIVVPALVTLPTIALGQLATLESEQDTARLREALSAIVLQPLVKFLLATTDVLLEHALTDGEQAFRSAGQAVADLGDQAPGFAALATVATGAVLPVALVPKDVKDVLDLCADLAMLWNRQEREPLLGLLGELMLLGLATPATRDETFATLLSSDRAPRDHDLQALLDRVAAGAWRTALLVVPRALQLVALHFVHEAEALALAVWEGAKALIAAAEAGVAWLAQQLDQLRHKLEELIGAAALLVGRIAEELARLVAHLLTLEDAVLVSIHDAGWAIVAPLISWAPGFVQDAARELYDDAFDGLGWVLKAPLLLLGAIATWVHDVVAALTAGGRCSRQAVDQEIRRRILAAVAFDLTIDLTVDLGTAGRWTLGKVTIPAGQVVGALASVVLGDGVYGGAVDTVVARAGELQANQTQQQTIGGAIGGTLLEQDAQAAVGALITGRPLVVEPGIPDGAIRRGQAILAIYVHGANLSFVDTPLGVPRRVQVTINGAEYRYTADQWKADGNAIRLSLAVVPNAVHLAPALAEPGLRLKRMRLPVGATLAPAEGATANEVILGVAQPAVLPPPTPGPLPGLPQGRRPMPAVPGLRPGAVLGSDDLVVIPASGGAPVTVTAAQDTVVVATASTGRGNAATELAQGWGWTLLGGATDPSLDLPVVVGNAGANVVQVSAADGAGQTGSAAATFYLQRA